MYLRSYKDWIYTIKVYACNECACELNEAWSFEVVDENTHFCWECSLKMGRISGEEYCKMNGHYSPGCDAKLDPNTGIVCMSPNGKFYWEKVDKDYRHTNEYKEWRCCVFERDGFTCQNCNKTGGKLEAHHILAFHKFKNHRYEICNGVTLCRFCHRMIHRKECNQIGISEHIRIYPFVEKTSC